MNVMVILKGTKQADNSPACQALRSTSCSFSSFDTPIGENQKNERFPRVKHAMTRRFFHQDILVLFSKSGATEELMKLAPYAKAKGAYLVAVTSSQESKLGRMCNMHVHLPLEREVRIQIDSFFKRLEVNCDASLHGCFSETRVGTNGVKTSLPIWPTEDLLLLEALYSRFSSRALCTLPQAPRAVVY